jgi:hypothetical protein
LSIQKPSTTDPVTVYVELLDEGTRCIRPTLAHPRDDGSYQLMATANYDPEAERWQFPPGAVVRCSREIWSSGEVLVARVRAPTK